jgi:hypothetical protein
MKTITVEGQTLVAMQCGTCSIWHALPKMMYDTCIEEGGYWHCPIGHSRGYAEGRKDREAVRRERDLLRQQTARLEDELREAKAETDKAKTETLAVKRRATAGICPCCNRTFVNVQQHMKTKHPNVTPLKIKEGVTHKAGLKRPKADTVSPTGSKSA